MKTFSYTATDKDWALRRGVLQAEDRIAALAELRRRGLTPVSVTEGRAPRAARGFSFPPRARVLAALGLLLLAAGGAWWWARERRGTPGATPAVPVVPAGPVTPAGTSPAAAMPAKPAAAAPVAPAPASVTPPYSAGTTGTVAAAATESAPAASKRPIPKRIIETIPGMATNPPPESGFSSGTERILNMVMNAMPGMPPPPLILLPPGEDLAKVLERDIGVFDDDDEQTIAQKANVAHAKQLLKEYLAQGGDPETFLEHYHGTLKQAFEERQAAQKYTMELIRAGDKKGAAEYMTRKNAELEKRGIMPVQIPAFMR